MRGPVDLPESRVLICIFDALRPDFLTPELMPNLHGFASAGTTFVRARSTFPTETRVNQSAVLTGSMPRAHGIVGNRFMADDLIPGRLIDTGDNDRLAEAATAGQVLGRPTMGQLLAASGRSLAALSAGTPGGGRLINLSAEKDGSHRLAMRAPAAAVPEGLADTVVRRIGPMPAYSLPATAWIDWAVDAYLDQFDAVIRPDAMLLWLCEPDESFHYLGIGSTGALETIAHADRAFGRILARHGPALGDGTMHIIAMSDHGQITLEGEPLDLPARLGEIGIRASTGAMAGADCVVAVHSAGGIWVRDRDPALTGRIVDWLSRQPWCGPMFTRGGLPGTLPHSEIRIDHPRAPDIAVALRAEDGPNEHGREGRTAHDAPYPAGGGCHGGLHRRETATVLTGGGARFRGGGKVRLPAGNIDVLPTALDILGLRPPDGIDGRALTRPSGASPREQIIASESLNGVRTMLAVTDLGRARYLDCAWIEN